jgi:Cdc6-like AAA superfamily ATPase
MDPGTALSIASLAYEITKDLYDYYRTWKDCDKDVADLRVQLLWLHRAFKITRDIVCKPGFSVQAVQLVYDALNACDDAANELREILDKMRRQGTPQSTFEKLKSAGRKSCYPFRKPTVTAIKANLDACRDELHLAADLLQLNSTGGIHQLLQELDTKLVNGLHNIDTALMQLPAIGSEISTINIRTNSIKTDTDRIKGILESDKEREAMTKILDWLCSVDYRQQQDDYYSRRQEGTGLWFLDSEKFTVWKRGTTHTLTCPGQPGVGKTIMAATVNHHLLHTENAANVGVIYLFCNYKRQNEQTLTHFLGALTRQLLYIHGKLPAWIVDMYSQHTTRNPRPSEEELKKALLSLTQAFAKIYLVIDALDECDRTALGKLLSAVKDLQAHGTTHLLFTTRFLPDILEQLPVGPVLEVRASDEDVSKYLRGRITTLPKCVRENRYLQDNIVAAIIPAVDGM